MLTQKNYITINQLEGKEDKVMKENGLGNIFVRHLVMAVPWGIISILVFFVAIAIIKEPIKESIHYGVQTALYESVNFVQTQGTIAPVKNNIKKGIAFAARVAKCGIKKTLNDPEIKQQVKNGMRYAMSEALRETADFALNAETFAKVKKNVKKGVEFTAQTGRNEIRLLLTDPDIKQQVKKALEYSGTRFQQIKPPSD